jgi:transposase
VVEPVAVTCEAWTTGFGLSRALKRGGSTVRDRGNEQATRPSGDRVKTDAKDAIHLARLLRLDGVTAVVAHPVEQEKRGT